MLELDTLETAKQRVPEHIVIKDDNEAMALFSSLHQDVQSIKDLIKKSISMPGAGSYVLTTIGFFATVKPKVAEQLVQYVKTGEVEGFVYLAYQHIYDALEQRKQKLKIEGMGTLANPGKKQIDDTIELTHMSEGLIIPGKISWLDTPTVPAGLVAKEWI